MCVVALSRVTSGRSKTVSATTSAGSGAKSGFQVESTGVGSFSIAGSSAFMYVDDMTSTRPEARSW